MNPQDALLQPRAHLWAEYRRREPGPSDATERRTDQRPPLAQQLGQMSIKPAVILLDPLSQSVVAGVGLVNASWLLPAYWYGLPIADESLRIAMFLRLGGVYNSRRR
jgi:hypothetical protein